MDFVDIFNDYFFPKTCLNCGKEGSWLCKSCKDSLFFIEENNCPLCKNKTNLFYLCENCRNEICIDRIFSLFKYSDFLAQKLIKHYKYRFLEGIIDDLKPALQKFLYKYKHLIDAKDDAVLIPIPLYWHKRCLRGFNQSELIAIAIAEILNIKVSTDLVIKKYITKNQAEIALEERRENIQGAFKIVGEIPKYVIIVDDIITTGSTMGELARILRTAGAEKIQAITLARG